MLRTFLRGLKKDGTGRGFCRARGRYFTLSRPDLDSVGNLNGYLYAMLRNVLMQAAALKRLVTRFSTEEIRELAPDARTKWLAMIDQHAQAYRGEVRTLENRLVLNSPKCWRSLAEAEALAEAIQAAYRK